VDYHKLEWLIWTNLQDAGLGCGSDPSAGWVQQPIHSLTQFAERCRLRKGCRGARRNRYVVHSSGHEAGSRQNSQMRRF